MVGASTTPWLFHYIVVNVNPSLAHFVNQQKLTLRAFFFCTSIILNERILHKPVCSGAFKLKE